MLFDRGGRRKYLTPRERRRFIQEALRQPLEVGAFCALLAFTGCRISEGLQLTPAQVDAVAGEVIIRSLKKRRDDHYRAVPVPMWVARQLRYLANHCGTVGGDRLWLWCRATAWKRVKEVMETAQVVGPHASPRGLRHGFAVAAIHSGVPLNLVQRWLGHADISITAIYADAIGEEERALAERLWSDTPSKRGRALARRATGLAMRAKN